MENGGENTPAGSKDKAQCGRSLHAHTQKDLKPDLWKRAYGTVIQDHRPPPSLSLFFFQICLSIKGYQRQTLRGLLNPQESPRRFHANDLDTTAF